MTECLDIQLVFASDKSYSSGLQIALASALAWIPVERIVHVHILDGGLDIQAWHRLQQMARRLHPQATLRRHDMRTSPIHTIEAYGGIGALAFARLHIPELIDAPRALYLDVDLLLLADLSTLFDQPLGDHWAAAVLDPLIRTLAADSPFPDGDQGKSTAPYFNSGVLLMDLEAWRRENIAPKAFVLLREYGPQCTYYDQTVLNHLLRGHWLELPNHWNFLSKHLSWSPTGGFNPTPTPAVLHYYAVVKPWISAIEPFPAHRLWHRFARRCAGLNPLTQFNRLVLRQVLIQGLRDRLLPAAARERRALQALLPPRRLMLY